MPPATAPTSPPPVTSSPSHRPILRWSGVALFAVGAVLLLRHSIQQDVNKVHGDGWEYWYQAESFHRHGSPELRKADFDRVNDETKRLGLGTDPMAPYAYATAPDGRQYGLHFWAYALAAVPAKEALGWTGECDLKSLPVTNAALFVLALAVTLFGSRAPVGERVALALLAAGGPVVWYLKWHGAEVYSWAFALMGVVAYRDGRYHWSGAAIGLAALQNPPLVLLGAAAVAAAAWERRWLSGALAALGAALGLIPYLFYQYHFGIPNLIVVGPEYAGVRNLSWSRTWGLATDWNHGLLPYAPGLVLFGVAGALRLLVVRNVPGLLLLGAAVGVALGTQVAHNWNSACEGLQRYLVWMIPMVAGVAVEGFRGWRRPWVPAAAFAALHFWILSEHHRADTMRFGYVSHTPAARWVLTRCPRLYWAEPEVFIERLENRDGWPYKVADFPVGFVADDGTVRKLLVEPKSVDRLKEKFEVDEAYFATVKEWAAGETGLFYIHPPEGAVRGRAAPAGR